MRLFFKTNYILIYYICNVIQPKFCSEKHSKIVGETRTSDKSLILNPKAYFIFLVI